MRKCEEGMSKMAYDRKGSGVVISLFSTEDRRAGFGADSLRCLVCSATQLSTGPT